MRPRSLIMLAAALLIGCTTEPAAAPAADSAGYGFSLHQEQRSRAYARRASPATAGAAALMEVPEAQPTAPPMPDASNMIIRTASASIEVDSLQPAVALLGQLATSVGGYVAGSGIETGKNQLRQAFIQLKIPAARFDEVVAGLTPIGKLESVNVDAQDVGEEFVDVTARMENARRLERRLIDLLATRTGKLKDVLDVERELARVREEVDRYEGRLRYLKAHTAMSTLSVTVHEPMPVVGTAGKSVMGEAFTQAWRNFVVLLSLAVQSLGVVLPLGFVAAVAWVVTRRWRVAKQKAA
jgi:Domain of unknown function (DUF4349)